MCLYVVEQSDIRHANTLRVVVKNHLVYIVCTMEKGYLVFVFPFYYIRRQRNSAVMLRQVYVSFQYMYVCVYVSMCAAPTFASSWHLTKRHLDASDT